jgi:hypothetical protein
VFVFVDFAADVVLLVVDLAFLVVSQVAAGGRQLCPPPSDCLPVTPKKG